MQEEQGVVWVVEVLGGQKDGRGGEGADEHEVGELHETSVFLEGSGLCC